MYDNDDSKRYNPCKNCSIGEEIINREYPIFGNECDGCFYFEYGCTEDEFFDDIYETDDNEYDCLTCSYRECSRCGDMLNCIY